MHGNACSFRIPIRSIVVVLPYTERGGEIQSRDAISEKGRPLYLERRKFATNNKPAPALVNAHLSICILDGCLGRQ